MNENNGETINEGEGDKLRVIHWERKGERVSKNNTKRRKEMERELENKKRKRERESEIELERRIDSERKSKKKEKKDIHGMRDKER